MYKKPEPGLGWVSHPVPVGGIGSAEAFTKGRTVVISSYAETRWPDESGEGPHWVTILRLVKNHSPALGVAQ